MSKIKWYFMVLCCMHHETSMLLDLWLETFFDRCQRCYCCTGGISWGAAIHQAEYHVTQASSHQISLPLRMLVDVSGAHTDHGSTVRGYSGERAWAVHSDARVRQWRGPWLDSGRLQRWARLSGALRCQGQAVTRTMARQWEATAVSAPERCTGQAVTRTMTEQWEATAVSVPERCTGQAVTRNFITFYCN